MATTNNSCDNDDDDESRKEVVGGRNDKSDDGQGEEAACTQIGRLASLFRHQTGKARCDWSVTKPGRSASNLT